MHIEIRGYPRENGMGIGLPVAVTESGDEYFNWDVFEYQGSLHMLSIDRDKTHVKLFPGSEIEDMAEITDTEPVTFDLETFETLLGQEIIPKPNEGPLDTDVSYPRLKP